MKEHIKIIDAMMESLKFSTVDRKPILPTLKVAKEAMSLQIKKKPKYVDTRFRQRGQRYGELVTLERCYQCPKCRMHIFDRTKNCPDCGQALDWEEVE